MKRVVASPPEGSPEIVLFRFGLRILRWSAWPYARGLRRDVETASRAAISEKAGLLHSEPLRFSWDHHGVIQYWSSFDALEAWSRRPPHSEWWRKVVDRIRTRGDLGIYHEAFLVARDQIESIYLNCPPTGLGIFGILGEPIGTKTTSRDRLNRRASRSGPPPTADDATPRR